MENNLELKESVAILQGKSLSYLLLTLTAFGWALSTILSKVCIASISPGQILLVRAVTASLIIFFAAPRKIMAMDLAHLKVGLILGVLIFFAYFTGVASLKYTTASKAAFLMALNVLLVPGAEAILKKRLPSKWIVVSVSLSLIGLWFISGLNGTGFNYGDFIALLCAVAYSIYIIVLDRWGRDKDDLVLSFIQMATLGVCSILVVALFEEFNWPGIYAKIWPLLVMGIFGMALPTFFQTKAQKTASPESVGIILLSDPLFALILAVIFLREPVFLSGLIGGAFILIACMVAVLKKI